MPSSFVCLRKHPETGLDKNLARVLHSNQTIDSDISLQIHSRQSWPAGTSETSRKTGGFSRSSGREETGKTLPAHRLSSPVHRSNMPWEAGSQTDGGFPDISWPPDWYREETGRSKNAAPTFASRLRKDGSESHKSNIRTVDTGELRRSCSILGLRPFA